MRPRCAYAYCGNKEITEQDEREMRVKWEGKFAFHVICYFELELVRQNLKTHMELHPNQFKEKK